MSTKMFCDGCGAEVTELNRPMHRDKAGDLRNCMEAHIKYKVGRAVARVIVRVEGSGDFCRHCVLDAVDRIDTRPRQAPEERKVLPSVGDFVYRNGTRHKVKSVDYGSPTDDLLDVMTCNIIAEVG